MLYSDYWHKLGLLGYGEVNLYNFLSYCAEKDTTFTMRGLAHQLGITEKTLIAQLDRLENCRLIKRSRTTERGRPIWIIICTPLFANKFSLTPKTLERITAAGAPVPEVFLSDVFDEMSQACDENHAKLRREGKLSEDESGEQFYWAESVKLCSGNVRLALQFDEMVLELMGYCQHLTGYEYVAKFNNYVRDRFRGWGWQWSKRWEEIANARRAFYDVWQSGQDRIARSASKPSKATQPQPATTQDEVITFYVETCQLERLNHQTATQRLAANPNLTPEQRATILALAFA